MIQKPSTVLELFEGHIERWTTKTFSRDSSGNVTGIQSPHTTCWCLLGAIWFIYDRPEFGDAISRAAEAVKKLYDTDIGIAEWQDQPERTFEEVLEVVKEAKI